MEEVHQTIDLVLQWLQEHNPYQGMPWMWLVLILLLVLKRKWTSWRKTISYGGIGLEVDKGKDDGEWTIVNVQDNSPAKQIAKKGDIIVKVDDVQANTLDSLAAVLRGPLGSKVRVTFRTNPTEEEPEAREFEVELKRKLIRAPANKPAPKTETATTAAAEVEDAKKNE